MNSITIKETDVANHPLLQERMSEGKLPGTREFVAFSDGVEAGILIFEHFYNDSLGFVYEIYVLKDFRCSGIGSLLLSHAETIALELSCETLRLTARSLDQDFINDEVLRSWYSRKGFIRDHSDSEDMHKHLTIKRTLQL